MYKKRRIFCPNCGQEVPLNADFCRSCGAKPNIVQAPRREEGLKTTLLREGPEAIDQLLQLLFDRPHVKISGKPPYLRDSEHKRNLQRIGSRLKELINSSAMDEDTLEQVLEAANSETANSKSSGLSQMEALIDSVSPITSNILWLITTRPDYDFKQSFKADSGFKGKNERTISPIAKQYWQTKTCSSDDRWENVWQTKTYSYRFQWQRVNAKIELARRGYPLYDPEVYVIGSCSEQNQALTSPQRD